jgi:uncharacterized protein
MTHAAPSPVVRVQVIQALVARELVEGFGLPERQAASLLGIVPSSVSQYLSGKRLGSAVSGYLGNEEARQIARRAAQVLMTPSGGSRAVLEAAISLGELRGAGSRDRGTAGKPSRGPGLRQGVPGWLRARIVGEQYAVAECMRLAQRSRDELTRALFRQIASDSLRHAEILASLAAYLDRGISSSVPTGITPTDVEQLIERERDAEATTDAVRGPGLGGVMGILWDSIEADERKHELLLRKLLGADRASSGHRVALRGTRVSSRKPNASRPGT